MKVCTFDIFDTCLCRTCGEPDNLFLYLARKVLSGEPTSTSIADFVYIRKKAEINAKKLSSNEDVTIDEIYNQADFSAITSLSSSQLKEAEIECEREVLSPIQNVLDKVNKYRQKGFVIGFVSDMYLPSSVIKSLLIKYKFFKEGDFLFVSGEIGKAKYTGNLFRHISKELKIKFNNWEHYGDNLWNDYKIPRKLGITAHLVKNNYSKFQNKLRSFDLNPTEKILSISAGISRSICLANTWNKDIIFCTDLIAPIYVPFVCWVLLDAQEKDIRNLYFLSRDGYIFYKIAKALNSIAPKINLHFLYVSRKSLYLPSIDEINEESLNSLLVHGNKFNIEELLDNLQIEIQHSHIEELNSQTDIVNSILSNRTLKKLIEDQYNLQKECSIGYFKQEGLANNEQKSAIVDLRGTRKCQKSMNVILKRNGYNPVFAYYLEVTRDRIIPSVKDDYTACFFGDGITNSKVYDGLRKSLILFEYYFSLSPFQRTSSYKFENGKFKPVFDNKEEIVEETIKVSNVNVEICSKYAEIFKSLGLYNNSTEILNAGLAVLSGFMKKPQKPYLYALKGLRTSQTQHMHKEIICFLTPQAIVKKAYSWLEGSLVLTLGKLGLELLKAAKYAKQHFYI